MLYPPRYQSEIAPMSSMLLFLVPFLAMSLVGCTELRAAHLYRQGTIALNAGDAELAISRLGQAEHLLPDASQIQNHLGLAFVATGQQEKALAAFQRAVELDCSNPAAVHNLAAVRGTAQGGQALAKTELPGEPLDER